MMIIKHTSKEHMCQRRNLNRNYKKHFELNENTTYQKEYSESSA